MQMTQNFTLRELIQSTKAKELGIENYPPEHLHLNLKFTAAGLERIRALVQKPIIVLSGYRCPELNGAVNGSPNSQHIRCEAADIIIPDYGTPFQVAKALVKFVKVLGIDQLILEKTWVHVSFTHSPRYQILTCTGTNKYEEGIV